MSELESFGSGRAAAAGSAGFHVHAVGFHLAAFVYARATAGLDDTGLVALCPDAVSLFRGFGFGGVATVMREGADACDFDSFFRASNADATPGFALFGSALCFCFFPCCHFCSIFTCHSLSEGGLVVNEN